MNPMDNTTFNPYIESKEKEGKSLHLIDLLKYLFLHWYWFALSILLFGGYYYYEYSKTPFLYSRAQTIMIKNTTNTLSVSRVTRLNNYYGGVNVAGEILQLRSKELMRNTISRLHADVAYSMKSGLRTVELYKESPFQVEFLDAKMEDNCTFMLTAIDSTQLRFAVGQEDGVENFTMVPFNKVLKTSFGRIRIVANEHFNKALYGEQITVTKSPREDMVGYFLGRLLITQMEDDATLLQMSIEDVNAERAAELLSMLIVVYNEETIEDKNRVAKNSAEFIKDRIAIIENELGSVETNLEQLKARNEGMDVNTATGVFWGESREYQSATRGIETQLRLVQLMRERIDNSNESSSLIPSNTGLVDENIESQISEYNGVMLKRNRLVAGNNSANPVVQDMDAVLSAIRDNIYHSVDNSMLGLRIRIRNLQKEEAESRAKAQGLPAKQRMMLSIERQQKVKEELYILLLNRREENALNQAMTDDNLRVVDPPSGSPWPIYPNKVRKVMTGVGIGVVLPTIALLLLLLLDTKVNGRKDIEEALTVPFLGEIPFAKTSSKGQGDVVVNEQGRDPVTEAFRILRTNIGFMSSADKEIRVITFTSFNVGAGKTFTALNLASSLTFLLQKVVLLDLDLRKGTMSDHFKLGSVKGVSHFLSDPAISLDQITYQSSLGKGLDIIPIGVIAPNPVELLLSKRLDVLISQLKERYRYIVVDNVPIDLVADAAVVNRISELTIFVVRAGKLDRRLLPEIEKIYRKKKLNNMAILLNGIRKLKSSYGYGYGYAYGYGYQKDTKGARGFFKRLFRR
ncbi:GumC family protein [Sphingobacterium sp. LRF_L2]|uniref:GumC family protein n=1 Tax=Sphingobacterium sp. LRF_L2 TaxID=3369421 RepID=UPI003F5F09C3